MEHALLIHITLSNSEFGTEEDSKAIHALEEAISVLLEAADYGELDGDEFGEGECIIYIYGPNADTLFSIIQPLLKSELKRNNGYVIKRYGEADDPSAREERIEL